MNGERPRRTMDGETRAFYVRIRSKPRSILRSIAGAVTTDARTSFGVADRRIERLTVCKTAAPDFASTLLAPPTRPTEGATTDACASTEKRP
jgi:hypothetical protein